MDCSSNSRSMPPSSSTKPMRAKRSKTDKAKAQRRHARRRALERFGLELNRKHLREIVGAIQAQKAELIRQQSLRVSLYRTWVLDQEVFVIYDRRRKEIVTFLTRAQVEHQDGSEGQAGAEGSDSQGVAE